MRRRTTVPASFRHCWRNRCGLRYSGSPRYGAQKGRARPFSWGSVERDTGLGFYVDDIEAACAAVASSGGRVVKRPEERPGEGITLATAVDTEGNRFSIAEPTPR